MGYEFDHHRTFGIEVIDQLTINPADRQAFQKRSYQESKCRKVPVRKLEYVNPTLKVTATYGTDSDAQFAC